MPAPRAAVVLVRSMQTHSLNYTPLRNLRLPIVIRPF